MVWSATWIIESEAVFQYWQIQTITRVFFILVWEANFNFFATKIALNGDLMIKSPFRAKLVARKLPKWTRLKYIQSKTTKSAKNFYKTLNYFYTLLDRNKNFLNILRVKEGSYLCKRFSKIFSWVLWDQFNPSGASRPWDWLDPRT